MLGRAIDEAPGDEDTSRTDTVKVAELVVEDGEEVETFWSLLARAGYTTW